MRNPEGATAPDTPSARLGRAHPGEQPRVYACIESTRDFRVGPFVVRVWRDEPTVDAAARAYCGDIVSVVSGADWKDAASLAEAVAAFEGVNAVQVVATHDANLGIVLYNNW